MAQFDYEAYIKDVQERTTNSQINCSEWRASNYTSYTVNLPDGSIVVVDKYNDNTKAIFYDFKENENDRVYKEVALIEHEPDKYHIKIADQNDMRVRIFGTHLDYDSDNEPEYEEEDNRDIFEQALEKGLYTICEHDDTNSLEIFYIEPKNLKIEDDVLKSNYRTFTRDNYGSYWALAREALE